MAERFPLPPFTLSFAGGEHAVRDGLAQLMTCLAPLSLTTEEAGTVELVMAEALNNVVEHALAATTTQTAIQLRGSHSAAGLRLTVIDQGAPMPKGQAPQENAPDVDVDMSDMPEGGFGWFMIHTLAQKVHYSRIGNANHLSLHLAVGL